MVRRGTRPTRRRGTTIVEAAFVIGICLLFLFAIYEYGRLVMIKNLLDNAAREGARYAVVHTSDRTTSEIQSHVINYLAGQDAHLQNVDIQVYRSDGSGANLGPWTDAGFGEYVAVQIECDYQPFFPTLLFLPSTMHLQARAIMCSEAN